MDGQYRSAQEYYSDASINMLIEESEKLYDKLAKPLVDRIIRDYGNRGRTSSLPSIPPADE
jgi:hypothetical protein